MTQPAIAPLRGAQRGQPLARPPDQRLEARARLCRLRPRRSRGAAARASWRGRRPCYSRWRPTLGDSPASCPAATWSSPNKAFEAVTEPPIASRASRSTERSAQTCRRHPRHAAKSVLSPSDPPTGSWPAGTCGRASRRAPLDVGDHRRRRRPRLERCRAELFARMDPELHEHPAQVPLAFDRRPQAPCVTPASPPGTGQQGPHSQSASQGYLFGSALPFSIKSRASSLALSRTC